MKTQILTILFLLGVSFGTANADGYCEEIHVVPVQNELQSCGGEQSGTVEVVIHNPSYCGSTIESISLSDSENFELNTSYGVAPCGSEVLCMRGYQFCTVGITFKPVTTSGTFLTDITVNRLTTAVATVATITGKIVDCCEDNSSCSNNSNCNNSGCGKQHRHRNGAKSCDASSNNGHGKHYRHRNGGKSCDVDHNSGNSGKQYHHRNGGKSCDSGCNNNNCAKQHRHRNGAKSCDAGCKDRKCAKQQRHHNGTKSCDASSNNGHGHGKHYRHRNGGKSCDVDHNSGNSGKQYRHRNGAKSCDSGCNNNNCAKQHRHRNGAKSCDTDHGKHYRHRHGKQCNTGGCDSSSTTSCTTPTVEQLYDPSKTNYIASLNLLDPSLFAPQISIVNDEVIFDNYDEQVTGIATFGLDETINFVSMLTFTANTDYGRLIPVMSGEFGEYMTNEIKRTNKYGFIFPSNLSLDELDFTTWGLSFTGSLVDLSVTEVTNTNILDKEQQ